MLQMMLDSMGINKDELVATAEKMQGLYASINRMEVKLNFIITQLGFDAEKVDAISRAPALSIIKKRGGNDDAE